LIARDESFNFRSASSRSTDADIASMLRGFSEDDGFVRLTRAEWDALTPSPNAIFAQRVNNPPREDGLVAVEGRKARHARPAALRVIKCGPARRVPRYGGGEQIVSFAPPPVSPNQYVIAPRNCGNDVVVVDADGARTLYVVIDHNEILLVADELPEGFVGVDS